MYDHVELIGWKCERGYSSVAEHSTADREVTGSTPVVPLELLDAKRKSDSPSTTCAGVLQISHRNVEKSVRCPGIEPGSQEWESCMIPLHQQRKLEMPGIEPGAFHMRSERSTTEPHPLTPRHMAWETTNPPSVPASGSVSAQSRFRK